LCFRVFNAINYSAALDIVQILLSLKKRIPWEKPSLTRLSCTFELRNSNSRDLKSVAEQQSIYEILAPILSGQASSRESGAQQQSRDEKKEFYLKIH
jgi:hypothetical protein